jgi:hypothetical protein
VAVALAVVGLGFATNQVTRIFRHGSLFEGLRNCVNWRTYRAPDCVHEFLSKLFDCHMCLGQEVAILLTWFTVGLFSEVLTRQQCVAFMLIGPFAVGGVDQLIELVREFQRDP